MAQTIFNKPLDTDVQENTQAIIDIWQVVYPIGSVYITTVNASPAILFGGTWEQIKGRFLFAAEDAGTGAIVTGDTGGSKTATLTLDQIPSHTHSFTPSGTVNSNNASHSHGLGGHSHSYTCTNASTGYGYANLAATAITANQLAYHNHTTMYRNAAAGGGSKPHMTTATYVEGYWDTSYAGGNEGHTHGDYGHVHGIGQSTQLVTGATGSTAADNATHGHTFTGTAGTTGSKGGDSQGVTQAVNIMPPYLAVYMWKRTA